MSDPSVLSCSSQIENIVDPLGASATVPVVSAESRFISPGSSGTGNGESANYRWKSCESLLDCLSTKVWLYFHTKYLNLGTFPNTDFESVESPSETRLSKITPRTTQDCEFLWKSFCLKGTRLSSLWNTGNWPNLTEYPKTTSRWLYIHTLAPSLPVASWIRFLTGRTQWGRGADVLWLCHP